ncbi:MAG: hypothetical protein ACR2P2_18835 [Nakamurella sp.]
MIVGTTTRAAPINARTKDNVRSTGVAVGCTPPRRGVRQAAPTGNAWAPLLTELARQLDTGRIYTRDLNTILPAFNQALQALNRRLPR